MSLPGSIPGDPAWVLVSMNYADEFTGKIVRSSIHKIRSHVHFTLLVPLWDELGSVCHLWSKALLNEVIMYRRHSIVVHLENNWMSRTKTYANTLTSRYTSSVRFCTHRVKIWEIIVRRLSTYRLKVLFPAADVSPFLRKIIKKYSQKVLIIRVSTWA